MSTVWKFTWPLPRDRAEFDMPIGAEVLHVAEQHGALCLWARVDLSESVERRQFALTGTGHTAPSQNDSDYLGTAMLQNGSLVLHVFEPRRKVSETN